jgi:hypothetical protein
MVETNAELLKEREAETCAGCRFYGSETDLSGYCRRYPPSSQLIDGEVLIAFAYTRPDVWCGEWKNG